MSTDLQARLKVFLASAPQTIRSIQTLEISHSAISPFYLWREPYAGTITTDTGVRAVLPLNFEIKLAGSNGHLDQKFDITLDTTDVADVFREQLEKIPVDTLEKIKCIYREYLSDDLTAAQAQATLQVESVSYRIGAATLSAVAPRLNVSRTGQRYTPKEVPTLRGFL